MSLDMQKRAHITGKRTCHWVSSEGLVERWRIGIDPRDQLLVGNICREATGIKCSEHGRQNNSEACASLENCVRACVRACECACVRKGGWACACSRFGEADRGADSRPRWLLSRLPATTVCRAFSFIAAQWDAVRQCFESALQEWRSLGGKNKRV